MATSILLANYAEQGSKNIKETTKRVDAVKELAKKAGCNMKGSYWTLGAYDVVAVFEAPDDEIHDRLRLEHFQAQQCPDTDTTGPHK
jgi:uncharacterized protein with GYD domain